MISCNNGSVPFRSNDQGRRTPVEKLFQLKANHTTVRTEIVAGITTFMTMAYIIALNPNLLTRYAVGTPLWNGVFLATCIASAVGTAAMAFLANKPFVMAPGMGLNSFFAIIAGNIAVMLNVGYESAFQAALSIILVEGVVFILLSVFNIREKIVYAIPLGVRMGIGPSIGLMLLNVGLGANAGVYSESGGPFYVLRDFFGAMTPSVLQGQIGSGYVKLVLTVATMFVGLFVIVVLTKRGAKAAVLLGMLSASLVYWAGQALLLKENPFVSLMDASWLPPFGDMARTTLFKVDFKSFFKIGWFTAITLVITFCMIDIFDTIGTLVGAASRAGMTDENGNVPKMKQALLADAIGTVSGALMGTSTVTTFAESASGVEAGGRTGLTALTASAMFLACTFLAPVAAVIPPAATSSALIFVGILMLQGLQNVDFNDIDQIVPVFIMLLAMPISGSIGHGIGLALICHTAIKVFSGKAREVSVLTYVISVLFIIKFFVVV